MNVADMRWADPAYRARIFELAAMILDRKPGMTLTDIVEYRAHLIVERMCGNVGGEMDERTYEDAMARADACEAMLIAPTQSATP